MIPSSWVWKKNRDSRNAKHNKNVPSIAHLSSSKTQFPQHVSYLQQLAVQLPYVQLVQPFVADQSIDVPRSFSLPSAVPPPVVGLIFPVRRAVIFAFQKLYYYSTGLDMPLWSCAFHLWLGGGADLFLRSWWSPGGWSRQSIGCRVHDVQGRCPFHVPGVDWKGVIWVSATSSWV